MAEALNYDERRISAPLIRCAQCEREFYMTVAHERCVECRLGEVYKRVAVALLVALLVGCSARESPDIDPRRPDTTGVLRLFGYSGIAHGCPVGEYLMLTARHVATVKQAIGPPAPVSLMWSDGRGTTGSAWVKDYDFRRDLALMESDRPFAQSYPIALDPPAIGERISIMGYNYGDRLHPDVLRVKVLNIVAAHLILEPGARPGFSGSCVLNEAGEVVGILTGAISDGVTQHAIAVGVYGPWADVGWTPKQ